MALRVGIIGRGRLGGLVAAAVLAEEAEDLQLAWTAGREGPPDGGDDAPADVAVDVSHPDGVAGSLDWAGRTGTDLVIGTTGWDRALLQDLPAGVGVLVAPNFSLSMALVRQLSLVLGRYAARTQQAGSGPVDLAVHEVHHRHKVDAPSGSAVLLARALAEGAGRPESDIATSSLRLGEVVGRHEVHFATPSESLVLTHEAHQREVFAHGALAAARWVHDRPGVHTFDDLAADELASLITTTSPQKEEP